MFTPNPYAVYNFAFVFTQGRRRRGTQFACLVVPLPNQVTRSYCGDISPPSNPMPIVCAGEVVIGSWRLNRQRHEL